MYRGERYDYVSRVSAEFRMQNYLIDLFCHPERQGLRTETIQAGEGSPYGSLFGSNFGKGELYSTTILAKSLNLQAVRKRRSLRLCFRPRETLAISG